MAAYAIVLGVMLLLIGAWTVSHPDGGYRPAAGWASTLSPNARRFAGAVMLSSGAAFVVTAV